MHRPSRLVFAFAFIFASFTLFNVAQPSEAQQERPRRAEINDVRQIGKFLQTARFARTVTVSKNGAAGAIDRADFTEPDAACAWVATQTRSATATWLVIVYPGNYSTDCVGAPVATPTFTSVFRYEDLSPSLIDAADTPADEECWTWENTDGVGKVEFQPCGGATGVPFNRVVIVDPDGGGDYLTIEEAVAFVATQTRSDTARWVIEVEPGPQYTIAAAPLAVPSYTTITGKIPHSIYEFYGQVRIVSPAMSSGTFITLDAGSALANVNVRFTGTLTGAAKVVEIIGGGAALINTTIENNASAATQAVSMVETTSSVTTSAVLYYDRMTSTVSATNLTYIKHQNSGVLHVVDLLVRSSTGAAAIIHNVSTGTVSLVKSVLGAYYSTNSDPNTFSLKNDSTGRIEPVNSVYFAPTSGVIDDFHTPVRIRTFVDTPFATCSPIPSEIALDIGTTKRICVCVAADDWDCAALTP